MKQLIKSCRILTVVSALAATTALAQINTFACDENGHGTFNGVALVGGLVAVDPSGGVTGSVLIYTLPAAAPTLTIGDVLLSATVAGNTNLSDVVRFWENHQVIFYSDREAGAADPALADSGLPALLLSNQAQLLETGQEGNNGASYLALLGQPGWDGGPNGTQYRIISDVPEPGTLLLASLGGGMLLVLKWRRQTKPY